MWIGRSLSRIPPLGSAALGRVCRLATLTPCTMRRASFGSTFKTSPRLPLSRPVMTTTWSPFLIFSLTVIVRTLRASPLQHFRRETDDLHELLGPELARDGAENARANRLALLGDEHSGVAIEADRTAVGAPNLACGAHDNGLMHVALLHAAARNCFLHRHDDDVADRRETALGAAQHFDALHPARARIVGHFQVRLHL